MIDILKDNPRFLESPAQTIDFGEEKWGVLFFNMGGPESPDDVGEYLYNIFSDPNIIKLPFSFILQKPLAGLISRRRAPVVTNRYKAIGGSPLLKWSRLAASGVMRELGKQYPQAEVFVGMRYFEPYIDEELDAAVGEGCRHIILFSMYPHSSQVTTGTALLEVEEWLDDNESDVTVSLISDWYNRPEFIALIRSRIDTALERVNAENATVIFSAHAVPKKLADSGDPYIRQIRECAALAGEGYKHILTFQSRTGPVKWVGPDTVQTVKKLGREGVKDIVIVPISFISDHIETLYEIDIELRDVALSAGIERFVRTESFNDDQQFIAFLADLIEEKIQGA